MADLETVDIAAVEILASGGPVHAVGSPPEGDFYTREELVAIADAHRELGNEIRAPIKLGHSDRQQLAANSGLTAGEMPALGWLDSSSFRVEDDADTGVAKLLADVKAVPKKVADLMEAGAYRTRSSEIRKYASQATQKSYDWVVDGLALLGEKVPAIQTLDDVYRLYERAGIDKPEADTFVIRRNAADDGPAPPPAPPNRQVWNVEDGLEDLRSDLNEALNPFGYDTPGVQSYWVRDIARSANVALVSQGWDDGDAAWVIPFAFDTNGDPVPADRSTWTAAEQTWIAATAQLARKNSRPAESRPMDLTLTDEQTAQLREKLAIDGEGDLTVDALVEAVETRANELATANTELEAAKTKVTELEARRNEATELDKTVRKLEADLKVEQTKRFEMERDADLTAAVKTGKIDPADLDEWQKDYEANQDGTRRVLARLKPDPDLVRENGRDDDGDGEELDDEALSRDFERRFGQRDPLRAGS